MNDIIMM